MTKTHPKKTLVTNPRTRRETKIDTHIYEPFKAAILKSLKGSKGKTFTEITDEVVKTIQATFPEFKGSKPWYTISVLKDLETRGYVENYVEKGKKYNRLKK